MYTSCRGTCVGIPVACRGTKLHFLTLHFVFQIGVLPVSPVTNRILLHMRQMSALSSTERKETISKAFDHYRQTIFSHACACSILRQRKGIRCITTAGYVHAQRSAHQSLKRWGGKRAHTKHTLWRRYKHRERPKCCTDRIKVFPL